MECVNRKLFNYFGEVKEINPYNIMPQQTS